VVGELLCSILFIGSARFIGTSILSFRIGRSLSWRIFGWSCARIFILGLSSRVFKRRLELQCRRGTSFFILLGCGSILICQLIVGSTSFFVLGCGSILICQLIVGSTSFFVLGI
jgi:hypothetical protein